MPLTQAVVLDAAMSLLDEVGLDELTTRRLATRLNVRVGALYWHYRNKQALLDAVADRIIAEAAATPLPDADWPDQLRALAGAQREAMLAHPDGARVVASMGAPGTQARAFFDRLIDILLTTGRDAGAAETGADVITSYVNGFTMEEQARKANLLSRAERDRAFDAGLDVVLNGLRHTP
ncbi:transcriptional regulator, TetR family [Streptoalloteichus tenebrarius]|uniref:Transcriptional regulator, TetR family n=1 Tax=Streptoalloteichus tenebrarius (strain ATCC 17920 / DSM 40477 / JCM 4838 / CBS 697.72 / NBRC 16177 / NCIMB 11028 / NRRL B-12390 / A12253. 1 / ISP 5477) TaxID=1933 RepID=A0ABT1HNH4_STRSD|nr:TetR/AcrR family transcriptional regulator C-terminal domain-containing protein [Streptoalloteichus tenebrarius]MCP2257055.1 transcriptional regulator, TetR family [Streptoalloteichus tenebrarius]BFE98686.1 tetracycline resistance transcriptional repressor TetR(A) [Streptoalloteichus tenebrarius]